MILKFIIYLYLFKLKNSFLWNKFPAAIVQFCQEKIINDSNLFQVVVHHFYFPWIFTIIPKSYFFIL